MSQIPFETSVVKAKQIQSALSFIIYIAWTDSRNFNGVLDLTNFTLQN